MHISLEKSTFGTSKNCKHKKGYILMWEMKWNRCDNEWEPCIYRFLKCILKNLFIDAKNVFINAINLFCMQNPNQPKSTSGYYLNSLILFFLAFDSYTKKLE
ncbi:hypothetical protein RF11_06303 [Thelohanellus kitauei]|uniref:Uncharacterized protein n=1 Tax=Thelohanellus kitauei TaxID=669202 RepID=A0A0C2MLM7_THEKT|nr:hypothetical protein RF11_06303 [Thelohanellus kitauei]